MNSSIRDYLPKQLALNEIVHTEEFTFKSIELPDGNFEYKQEYELSKSPVINIRSVTATVDNEKLELDKDEDYYIDDGVVVFNNESNIVPDLDTKFTVTYKCESVLSRYISSIEERTEILSNKVGIDAEKGTIETSYKENPNAASPEEFETITSSKYISTAEGDSLDEIGELFGDLGSRAGRDDDRYREYLQSIATVYTGSGRKKNVAEAAATIVSDEDNTVDPDTIEFDEFFDEQEFSIRFNNFENHRVSLIDEVIDLADPSGVRLRNPIYVISDTGSEHIEGPKPDLSKYENINSVDVFDDDFISPFNHKSPTRGQYPSNVSVQDGRDVLDSGLLTDVSKPIEFRWAEKIENDQEEDTDPNWSEFQWAEDDWAGTVDEDVYFTGVKWEQADWNKFPYTDYGVVGSDFTTSNDSPFLDIEYTSPRGQENVTTGFNSVANITYPSISDTTSLNDTILSLRRDTVDDSTFSETQFLEIDDTREDSVKTNEAAGPASRSDDPINVGSGFAWNDDWGTNSWEPSGFLSDEAVVDDPTAEATIANATTEESIVTDPISQIIPNITFPLGEDITLQEDPVESDIEDTTDEDTVTNDVESKSVQQAGIIWNRTDWNETSWDKRTEHINVSDPLLFDVDFTSPIATESVTTDPISTPIPNITFPFSEDVTLQEDPVLLELDDSIPEDVLTIDDVEDDVDQDPFNENALTGDSIRRDDNPDTTLTWSDQNWNEQTWKEGQERDNNSHELIVQQDELNSHDIVFNNAGIENTLGGDSLNPFELVFNNAGIEDVFTNDTILETSNQNFDTSVTNDSNTLEVENTNTEDTTSNETLSVDVTEIGWGANWNTLQWPRA